MIRRVVATAPGKLILMGEHAAVYGRPAVVAALGLCTAVEVETGGEGVELDLETLGHRETSSWAAIDAYTAAYAERWRRFDQSPTSGAFAALADHDPARLVKLALGETRRAQGLSGEPGVRVRVASEIPVGSGFGSSASVAVAVAGGLLALLGELAPGEEADFHELLSAVALEVERRQHGRPSGIDHATVLRGGVLRVGGGPERRIEPLAVTPAAAAELRVFDTGRPAETTGEVVAAVRSRREADPTGFDAILDAMESATGRFADALTATTTAIAIAEDPRDRLETIRAFERHLEDLGVVPAGVGAAVRRIEERGGAAKVSGAGTLAGTGAGALLVCWPSALDGEPEDLLPGYPCHRAAIGAPGLTIEEAA